MATSQTPELETVQKLLQGRDATLADAMTWLHRHLQGDEASRLRRIELRYAQQGRAPVVPADAQARLGELCRQKGLVGVAVSVRPHELPMDNDLGHLRIRLKLEPPPQRAEGTSWRLWLAKLRAHIPGFEDDELVGDAAPMRQAVETLQRGLDEAVKQHRTAGRSAEVHGLHIVVFSEELHRSLAERMPPAHTHSATLWLSRELLELGLQPDAQFEVRYEYRPPLSDSTNLVSDCALSARLLLADEAAHPKQPPELGDTPMPVQDDETPLPQDEGDTTAPALQVLLRVLGTWQAGALQPLPQPFEATLGSLPTQFSRSMLEVVGFTATPHATLAGAASNSTPLGFATDGQGGVKLHSAARTNGMPMYHFVADGKPCLGEHPLTGPLQLVVNGPGRLRNGLWPLVIEVQPSVAR